MLRFIDHNLFASLLLANRWWERTVAKRQLPANGRHMPENMSMLSVFRVPNWINLPCRTMGELTSVRV